MGIFDFLSQRNKNTASTARDRLRILIQQERSMRGAPTTCRCCSANCWK